MPPSVPSLSEIGSQREPWRSRVALVHAVEVGREQGGLVAAGAGADLHDGVAVIVRVAGEQQLVQLLGQGGDFVGKSSQVGFGERDKLGIGLVGELPRLVQVPLEAGEPFCQT